MTKQNLDRRLENLERCRQRKLPPVAAPQPEVITPDYAAAFLAAVEETGLDPVTIWQMAEAQAAIIPARLN